MEWITFALQQEEERIQILIKEIFLAQSTSLEELEFQQATDCHICRDGFRDHCRLTGK